jgi:SAM-dependent methyltransferase
MFNIEENYVHRTKVTHHDDRTFTDKWQKAIYSRAKELNDQINGNRILDIGCGSGYKLMKNFSDKETYGVELEPALSFLIEKYPDRVWLESDFSRKFEVKFNVIICSDVVEHIENPDNLLEFINNQQFDYLVISTPAREMYKDNFYMGPPRNSCHYREWKCEEFKEYISNYFNVLDQSIMAYDGQYPQVIVAEKKK